MSVEKPAETEILTEIEQALRARTFVSGTFSERSRSNPDVPTRQTVRPVTIRGEHLYQWALRFELKETHENLDADRSSARIADLLRATYRQAQLSLESEDLHLRRDRSERLHVSRRPAQRKVVETGNDRAKSYLIPEGVPCPFLIAQGVMREDGRVLASMQHKFRQVNRFLEFVNDIYSALPAEGTLHVVDYGCGKSYLTFAIHHLLTVVHHRKVEVLGLDRNPEVVETCRRTVDQLQLDGIRFESTRIDAAERETPLHLAVALHACDTATDDALADAVRRGAAAILAAPCCQHEVADRMRVATLPLMEMHGIVHERLAALATDSLRGAALEIAGYRTQAIEFIETDHTPKNLLLRAVARRPNDAPLPKWREQYAAMKQTFGLEAVAVDQVLEAAAARRTSPPAD